MRTIIDNVTSYTGNRFYFKYMGIEYNGIFRGIWKIGDNCGMIFSHMRIDGIGNVSYHMPYTIFVMVHPQTVKCTIKDDFRNLRRICRNIFKKMNIKKYDMLHITKNLISNGMNIRH